MRGAILSSSEKLLIKLAQDVRYYAQRRRCREEDALAVLLKIGMTPSQASSYLRTFTGYQRDCIEFDYILNMRRQYV